MTTLREAAQQALEALELYVPKEDYENRPVGNVIDALRAALAEPVQEPQSTHSAACYQWHHKCAIAEVERLRAALAEPVQEPVQEPFALPCPTPKACKAHCCSGHCVPRTNHPNHMTRIPPMLCIPHRIPDCPKCMSTHAAPPRRKPLTEEEIERLWYPSAVIAEPGKRRVAFGRAVERAHGIGGGA